MLYQYYENIFLFSNRNTNAFLGSLRYPCSWPVFLDLSTLVLSLFTQLKKNFLYIVNYHTFLHQ